MVEYTSTLEGFQRAMKWSLTGPAEESQLYAEATSTPDFYHLMNNQRIPYGAFIKGIEEWRGGKTSDYEPVVHEFLRDGDQLATRMTGTIRVDGVDTEFESFMFGKVDKQSGKLEYLIERSVWGPVGGAPEHGVNT
ncbi:mitochondrial substrate carrier protein [Diplogelasinospora grovesii]|uniref:Mitochondrial substrate carrier protein n=1 Tax=Diplogelasinospora grovesii TaxID=303347 RepID=A0AAN6S1P5_9PEZI|nr:mitochondrial substrate carrier protein [Diplogelasinospora grovesii]